MNWINIKETLPPFATDVLFLLDQPCMPQSINLYVRVGQYCCKNRYMIYDQDKQQSMPLAWMELPSTEEYKEWCKPLSNGSDLK